MRADWEYSARSEEMRPEQEGSPFWKIALYIRLSKEDGRGDESESVANQRRINMEYIREKFRQGSYVIAGEFVDDGRTGTSEETRPEFQRLCREIEGRRVNCVVCKTLSRAFRNYADQGKFLEQFLPANDCRFIAVGSPFVDTYADPDCTRNLEIPINGLMNDRYAARTSEDVRRTFRTKRKNGEFIGAFAPYGYRKDPKNKNRFLIDEEAAEVVREIYRCFLDGVSRREIARRLNEGGILCPTRYKQERLRQNYRNPSVFPGESCGWSARTVGAVLKNRVYCGDMVQGRYRIKSYKVHIQERVPESEWFLAENTHAPLVSREVFRRVQELCRRDRGSAETKEGEHLFGGLLRCGDCRKAMSRTKARDKIYYYCSTYKRRSACSKHRLRREELEAAVLWALNLQAYLLLDWNQAKTKVMRSDQKSFLGRENYLAGAAAGKEKMQSRIARYRRLAYEDWKDGRITWKDYQEMKADYDRQESFLWEERKSLEERLKEERRNGQEKKDQFCRLCRGNGFAGLSRGVLVELIECILVYEDGRICIRFRFADGRKC